MVLSPTPDQDGAAPFLAAISEPRRRHIQARVAVVVAHPDDETIGCGALLGRVSDPTVIHVTDGAPRSLTDARALGFPTAEAYAAQRRRELESAMALVGVGPDRLVSLGWPDQEASLHLAEIAAQLTPLLAGLDAVITHAYEGGHPDHDATAFAVHSAVASIRAGERPIILETPLYRAGLGGWAVQSFAPDLHAQEILLELDEDEQRLKQAMFDAFASQRHVLPRFSLHAERFRPAPSYDFRELPNGGDLLYERMQWGMTGARWIELSRAALANIRRGAAA